MRLRVAARTMARENVVAAVAVLIRPECAR